MEQKTRFYRLFSYQCKKVKHLLSHAQSKELLTFLFFLGLSFVFWVLQSINDDNEAKYKVEVRYENIPSDIVLTGDPTQEIDVAIKDKGVSLLNYALRRKLKPITVNVAYRIRDKADKRFTLREDDLIDKIKNQLSTESEVISVRPSPVVVNFEKLESKMLPVRFEGEIQFAPQFQLSGGIKLTPDSMEVYAMPTVLDSLTEVVTSDEDITNVNDTIQMYVPLQAINHVKFKQSTVKLYAPVSEFTEKTLHIPLNVVGLPDSIMMRTFPSEIKVTCIVDIHNFKKVNSDQFRLEIDYSDIQHNHTEHLPVRIVGQPTTVSNIRLTPSSVDYILEEKANEEDWDNGGDRLW